MDTRETKETHTVERTGEGADYRESTERTVETHKTTENTEPPKKRTIIEEETITETYTEE